MPEQDRRDPARLETWIELARRRWRTGAAVFLAVFLAAAALLLLAHPVYRAETRLRLGEPPPMGGVSPSSGLFSLLRLGGDPFANDLELLSSRTLAERVVEDAALAATVQAPRGWHRDSLFHAFAASPATEKATFEVTWLENGQIGVGQTAPADTFDATFVPVSPARFGGLTVVFRPWREDMPRSVTIHTLPFGEAVRRVRGRIAPERTRRDANVIEIAFDDTDPGVAEAATAAAVRRFVELRTEIQGRESGQTVDSIRTVAARTMEELRAAEAALEDVQRRTRLFSPEVQGEAFVERYSTRLADLETGRTRLAGIDSVLVRATRVDDPSQAWMELAGFPIFLENPTIGAVLEQLTKLESERRALLQRRTESSRELRLVESQIAYLDGVLRSVAVAYRASLAEGVAAFGDQVRELDSALAAMPADVLEFVRRQRDVRILSEVVVVTEQRLRQEELRQALTFANVQVIDPPALLHRPVWPRKKLGLAVAFMIASGFGVLGMTVAERADRRLRTADDIRRAAGVPVLATVVRRGTALAVTEDDVRVLLREGNGSPGHELVLAPVGDPEAGHEVAEAIRRALNGAPGGNGSGPVVGYGRIDTFGAAVAAAEKGAMALVVELARSRADEVARTADLIRAAGGRVVGAVVVCKGVRDAASLWR